MLDFGSVFQQAKSRANALVALQALSLCVTERA